MNDIYEKNLNALKKHQPNFTLPVDSESENVVLHKNDDGFLDVLYNGLPLHESAEETAARTEGIVLNGNGLMASFGLGLGYEARDIIRKMDKGTSFVIVLPCDEVFALAVRSVDLVDIISAPNVWLLDSSYLNDDEGSRRLSVFLRGFISSQNYKNLSAFVISPYVKLFFEKCRRLLFAIDLLRESFELNEATILRFTSVWQRNALLNARHCTNSVFVSSFFDKLRDVPAIIVSAGPSLSKNIATLKKTNGKCLIISVDTALKPLLANGITPHFVVSLDAQQIVEHKLSGIAWETERIPLIYVPTSSAGVVSSHKGEKVLSPAQDNFFRAIIASLKRDTGILQGIDMGGSVSTGAFSFAQRCGCNPIVLIGQDLAFTDGRSHAEGAVFAKDVDVASDVTASGLFTVDGENGEPVFTDRIFQTYRTWFKTYRAADTSDRQYINATEGGARLDGFVSRTLSKVTDDFCTDDKSDVKPLLDALFENAARLDDAEKSAVFTQYKKAAKFLLEIKDAAEKASGGLEKIGRLLSVKKPNLPSVKALHAKTSPLEDKIKAGESSLNMLGIAVSPLAEKLSREFESAQFNNELEKNVFAAKSYSRYYKELAARISEFDDLLKLFSGSL